MRTLELDPVTADLIRDSFALAVEQKHVFARAYFDKLVALAPRLRYELPFDVAQRNQAFIDWVSAMVRAIDSPARLRTSRVARTQPDPWGYELVADRAFFSALEQSLESAYLPAVAGAWAKLFEIVGPYPLPLPEPKQASA